MNAAVIRKKTVAKRKKDNSPPKDNDNIHVPIQPVEVIPVRRARRADIPVRDRENEMRAKHMLKTIAQKSDRQIKVIDRMVERNAEIMAQTVKRVERERDMGMDDREIERLRRKQIEIMRRQREEMEGLREIERNNRRMVERDRMLLFRNHAKLVQETADVRDLKAKNKDLEKKYKDLADKNKRNSWSYKQKNKFQKKITRPNFEPEKNVEEKMETDENDTLSKNTSGPLKRRHSLKLFYRHPDPEVKTVDVCEFTNSADVILMARSKNCNKEDPSFNDVCIPLHKEQLLENVPYFSAMFGRNWRENSNRSYSITDDGDRVKKALKDLSDIPSTSKNPPKGSDANQLYKDFFVILIPTYPFDEK